MISQLLFNQKSSPQIGALAGAIATIPMTAVMMATRKIQSGSARPILPEKVTSGVLRETGLRSALDADQKQALTWGSHFAFGAGAATLYPLFKKYFKTKSVVGAGAVYGLGVWAANYWGILPALKIKALPNNSPAKDNVMGIVSHLVWGIALAGAYRALSQQKIFGNHNLEKPVLH